MVVVMVHFYCCCRLRRVPGNAWIHHTKDHRNVRENEECGKQKNGAIRTFIFACFTE